MVGAEAREARRRADEALTHEITVIHIASRRNYGVPRVTAELRRPGRLGRPVNRKRVARVMRERGIARPDRPGLHRHPSRNEDRRRHHLQPHDRGLALPRLVYTSGQLRDRTSTLGYGQSMDRT